MSIRRQIIYWLPVYVYVILIFYFSSQSIIGGIGGAGGSFSIIPYLKHSLEYFILGVLLFRGFFNSKFKKRSFSLSLVFGSLYALSDEIHQLFVVGRNFSFLDIGFDFLGIIIGVLIIRRFYKFLCSFKK